MHTFRNICKRKYYNDIFYRDVGRSSSVRRTQYFISGHKEAANIFLSASVYTYVCTFATRFFPRIWKAAGRYIHYPGRRILRHSTCACTIFPLNSFCFIYFKIVATLSPTCVWLTVIRIFA